MNNKKNLHYFPVRKKNQFKLLINSTQYYPAIIDAINQAETEILIENYLTKSGKVLSQFISALIKAAERNVTVYCLFDSFGSNGILKRDLDLLNRKNIHIHFYNRIKYQKLLKNLFRDHRKIYIIDRSIAFIGGAGISDQFDTSTHYGWHDIMLSIKGDIIQDWFLLFKKNWIRFDTPPLSNLVNVNTTLISDAKLNQSGKVIEITAPHRREIKRLLRNEILNSKESIWFTTPYFVPSRKFRRLLIHAARRGVDVKILLPGSITDHPSVRIMGQRYYAQLLRHGVQIFEYSLHFSHAKVLLCDHWLTTGSSNFDRWNFRWNLEANQIVLDKKFSHSIKQWFEQELKNCNEVSYEQWRNRSLWQRSKEWFWGLVVQILEQLKRPKN